MEILEAALSSLCLAKISSCTSDQAVIAETSSEAFTMCNPTQAQELLQLWFEVASGLTGL